MTAKDDEVLIQIVQEDIEERWDEANLVETDKSWDAMHRALHDGSLSSSKKPLSMCILGGKQLHRGDDYIISYKSADDVQKIAKALASIGRDEIVYRYRTVVPSDYDESYGDQDCHYTADYFESVKAFYQKAAADGRSVIFTVDQ